VGRAGPVVRRQDRREDRHHGRLRLTVTGVPYNRTTGRPRPRGGGFCVGGPA
jgi:hypothetical protein